MPALLNFPQARYPFRPWISLYRLKVTFWGTVDSESPREGQDVAGKSELTRSGYAFLTQSGNLRKQVSNLLFQYENLAST
jgi:hypothetical protein